MSNADPWTRTDGLVLRPWRARSAPRPLAACCSLRVADIPQLLANSGSWRGLIDRAVIALGSWSEPDSAASIERGAETLRAAFGPRAVVLPPPPSGWGDQCRKRSAYFAALQRGEVALVLDADERVVAGAEALAAFASSSAEVGWLLIQNPARYARAYKQPRLFAVPEGGLAYRGRHHWVWNRERLVATHQYAGPGWLHETVPATILNEARGPRTERWREQHGAEAAVGHRLVDRWNGTIEPLRILHLTKSDDGLVAYRLHSGLNATSPHFSAFGSGPHPFRGPRQYRWPEDRSLLRQLLAGADVVHCHTDYSLLDALGMVGKARVVIHHHGTRYRRAALAWARADRRAALRLCSNLDLLDREPRRGPQWLPNPVPVGLYAQMAGAASARARGPLRVAHSPSQPGRKGTESLVEAQAVLRKRGVEINLEILSGLSHAEVLQRKAACDVTFDSFWLGIQCSGLEGAAMGQAVIAGDPVVGERYRARLGSVPYTYANDAASLADVLERMATDPAWRVAEAARVSAYVLEHHDEGAVAARYFELLHTATGCWAWKPAQPRTAKRSRSEERAAQRRVLASQQRRAR